MGGFRLGASRRHHWRRHCRPMPGPGASQGRGERRRSRERPQASRPAAGASRPATMRSRLVLPLPLLPVSTTAPPAGKRNDKPAKTRRSPRRQAISPAIRSETEAATAIGNRRPEPGSSRKKAAPAGESGAAHPSAEWLDRVRGLGDKPVRINPTHAICEPDWDFCLKKV